MPADMSKPEVLFILSIDTEEEWDWSSQFPSTEYSLNNIQTLPAFQAHCTGLGVRPTYFVDYAVANAPQAQAVISDIARSGHAEIGAHLHPWCNPPLFGETTDASSHVVNLPLQQTEEKLDCLMDVLENAVGVHPRSFRSGRWGMNGEVLTLLRNKGFRVDSSVYPFYENEYFSCAGAPTTPYWPSLSDPLSTGAQRDIMELPVTAGFNLKNARLAEKVHSHMSRSMLARLKAVGVLWHTRLLRKIYLSPELSSSKDMNRLIDSVLANQAPCIHMYLHSSSLIDGATGLLPERNAFANICQRISASLHYLQSRANVKFCTITEAAELMARRQPDANPLYQPRSVHVTG